MPGGSDDAIISARPVFAIDGAADASLSDALIELRIDESLAGLAACELRVGNWGATGEGLGFQRFGRDPIDFGKPLSVEVAGATIFSGRISALEGIFPEGAPPQLAILAEDALQPLRMTRRTRAFEQASDADVVRQIASDHSLDADVDLAGPTHRVLAQVNQSDLAFLRERVRAVGGELLVRDGRLHAKARPIFAAAPIALAHGGALRSFTATADLAHQRTAVTVAGWDVASKAATAHESDDSLVSGELGDGESGASLLEPALGACAETIVHTLARSDGEARAEAEALARRRARGFVRARGVAEPGALLLAGSAIDVSGVGPLFEGEYHVVAVRWRFDAELGLRTEFWAERPGLGRAS